MLVNAKLLFSDVECSIFRKPYDYHRKMNLFRYFLLMSARNFQGEGAESQGTQSNKRFSQRVELPNWGRDCPPSIAS